jgi:nitrogen regulatory protein PII 2
MTYEICTIIRSGAWRHTLAALEEAGFHEVTRQRAFGRGKQGGLKPYKAGKIGKPVIGIRLLPKWVLTLLVEETEVNKVLDVLESANRTGEIGDGRIFVSPLGVAVSPPILSLV